MLFNKALTIFSLIAVAFAAPHGSPVAAGAAGAVGAKAHPVAVGAAGAAGAKLGSRHEHAVAAGAAGAAGAVVGRDVEVVGVAQIFTTLQVKIAEPVMELQYLQAANATVAIVTPIVAQITGPLTEAIASLKLLVGLDVSVILAPVVGVKLCTVAEISVLVVAVVHLVLNALACLMAKIDITVLIGVFAPCGGLLATLLTLVFGLVAGLEVLVAGLLADVADVVATLGFTLLGTLLHLL